MHLTVPEIGRPKGDRIAVIGSGLAGLSAAWLLSKRYRVCLYEKNAWHGGHANTVDVPCPEGSVAVDTGFIVYNEENYPNFSALLTHFGVATTAADMSLGVSIGSGRIEYSSKPWGLFGQKRNLFVPRFWRMLADILKFYGQTRELKHEDVADISLGEFLEREEYSDALIDQHVLPMCAAIWSTTAAGIRDYPMRSFLRFFSSHGLLQVTRRPQWRSVEGGSRKYVRAMMNDMAGRIELRSEARSVARHDGACVITDANGSTEIFNEVVMAVHADQALELIDAPTTEEKRWLGAFRYTDNVAVLHDDRSLMPRRRSVWASWNYVAGADQAPDQPLCVSYWMNRLQKLQTKRQLFVTLNPLRSLAPGSVIQSFDYTHPMFDAAALDAQSNLWRIQGRQNIWYCGSYFGYGFHEDALQSGIAVARAFGVAPPWAETSMRIAEAPTYLAAAE